MKTREEPAREIAAQSARNRLTSDYIGHAPASGVRSNTLRPDPADTRRLPSNTSTDLRVSETPPSQGPSQGGREQLANLRSDTRQMLSEVLGETVDMLGDIVEETADALGAVRGRRSAPPTAPPRQATRPELRAASRLLPPQRLLEEPTIETELIEELRSSHQTREPQDVIEAEVVDDVTRGTALMRTTAVAIRRVTGLPRTPNQTPAVPGGAARRGSLEEEIQTAAAAERARVQSGAAEMHEWLALAVAAIKKP